MQAQWTKRFPEKLEHLKVQYLKILKDFLNLILPNKSWTRAQSSILQGHKRILENLINENYASTIYNTFLIKICTSQKRLPRKLHNHLSLVKALSAACKVRKSTRRRQVNGEGQKGGSRKPRPRDERQLSRSLSVFALRTRSLYSHSASLSFSARKRVSGLRERGRHSRK